ncbi:MAG: hypothetical protein ABI446_05125 [Gemmatimonadaceae bacterium]
MSDRQFVKYEIGFDKANGLISKATDADLGPIEIPVDASGKTILAARTFRASRDKLRARGSYTVKIKLCNPGC